MEPTFLLLFSVFMFANSFVLPLIPTERQATQNEAISEEQALDQVFVSSRLGIRFHYPSTFLGECADIPVTVKETSEGVAFFLQWTEGKNCHQEAGRLFTKIFVRHVVEKNALLSFVQDVVSPRCTIQGETPIFLGEAPLIRLWIAQDPMPVNEPDLVCLGQVFWNQDKGVALYTLFGEKTGGAAVWPAPFEIQTVIPEVGAVTDTSYDSAILSSMGFL